MKIMSTIIAGKYSSIIIKPSQYGLKANFQKGTSAKMQILLQKKNSCLFP